MTASSESLADVLRGAAGQIEQCREEPVAQAKQTLALAMTCLIRTRNEWMTSDRCEPGNATLRRLNVLLSLMSSVEFPLEGFHRKRIDAVLQELHATLETLGV